MRERVISVLLWLLQRVEPCKSEGLSYKLHGIADRYARSPTGAWE